MSNEDNPFPRHIKSDDGHHSIQAGSNCFVHDSNPPDNVCDCGRKLPGAAVSVVASPEVEKLQEEIRALNCRVYDAENELEEKRASEPSAEVVRTAIAWAKDYGPWPHHMAGGNVEDDLYNALVRLSGLCDVSEGNILDESWEIDTESMSQETTEKVESLRLMAIFNTNSDSIFRSGLAKWQEVVADKIKGITEDRDAITAERDRMKKALEYIGCKDGNGGICGGREGYCLICRTLDPFSPEILAVHPQPEVE